MGNNSHPECSVIACLVECMEGSFAGLGTDLAAPYGAQVGSGQREGAACRGRSEL